MRKYVSLNPFDKPKEKKPRVKKPDEIRTCMYCGGVFAAGKEWREHQDKEIAEVVERQKREKSQSLANAEKNI